MHTDARWPRFHIFIVFGVQLLILVILLGIAFGLLPQDSSYWESNLSLSAASLILIYTFISVELLTLVIQTICLIKSRLSPLWLAIVHGCFSAAWLAALGVFFASEGVSDSIIADGNYHVTAQPLVPVGGCFATLCFLASLYVALFSAYIFLRGKHSPPSDVRSPDLEVAEYVPVVPPKGTGNSSQAPGHFTYDKQEAALPQDRQEALQYPFTPQELPNNAGLNPSPSNPRQEAASPNNMMINGILYQAVPNAQIQGAAYGVQPSQGQVRSAEGVPELQASVFKRKPVELATGSVL